jgi:hypothetical protein
LRSLGSPAQVALGERAAADFAVTLVGVSAAELLRVHRKTCGSTGKTPGGCYRRGEDAGQECRR